MKRIQSILCASLLTLGMSSATFAGNIYGSPTAAPGTIYGAPGNIYGAPGNIYGAPGTIYGITDDVVSASLEMVVGLLG